MEADWQKFSAMIPMLHERYLAERNARITRKLTDPIKTETERFWNAFEEIEKEAKIVRRCLDDYSRSKMWLSMITMRAAGMLKKEDFAGFSEQLQKDVLDDPFEKRG
jgi:hypothetical protein